MGKFITKFDTTSEYESAVTFLNTPHVSLTKDDMNVHFKQFDPYNGHEYVEIGGLKWATMNIGAESITDYGLYFQWGDTQGYTASQIGSGGGLKYFYWDDYKYWTVDTTQEGDAYASGKIIKYNSYDGKTVLDKSDDAAQANWGGSWRIPTKEEFSALIEATTSTWITDYQGSGINGRLFTDKIDNSKVLFFPAAGYCLNGNSYNVGSNSYCQTSSFMRWNGVNNAYLLNLNSSTTYIDSGIRYCGQSVRGVIG